MKTEKTNGKIIIRISIMWIFVLAIIIALVFAFFKNYIFATNETNKEEQQVEFEENENAVNTLKLMVENNYSNKKLVNEERDIQFETIKQDDDQLPKGEEKVTQEGQVGKKQVTAMQVYQENQFLQEQIIESIVTKEPVTQIVHVGKSEYLSKYNVHIGEEMYLIEAGDIKKEAKEDAEIVYSINRYLNVELLEISDKWAKIKYKEYEGYIENSKLTSESVTPKIKEKNRIANLKEKLSIDMNLNEVSGLTLSDYKTILGHNESDKNSIFASNAEVFYDVEQQYQINGVFVAAIGIHESAWGTSKIAQEKNNLFGYKAYDRDPAKYAQQFETYEECIRTVAEALCNNYLTSTGSFYNGTTVQDVNKKYASDKEWYNKVFSYMEYLYDKLG